MGIYKKWSEKSHCRISLSGTGSEDNAEGNARESSKHCVVCQYLFFNVSI